MACDLWMETLANTDYVTELYTVERCWLPVESMHCKNAGMVTHLLLH